jgi:hypothetical protein
MDRQSFIRSTYLNNSIADEINNCGKDDCECNVINLSPAFFLKTSQMLLAAITVLAFVCAFSFETIRTNITTGNMLSNQRSTAISCGINNSINEKEKLNGTHRSNDNKKNSCPHQPGSSCLGCMNETKRKKLHIQIV